MTKLEAEVEQPSIADTVRLLLGLIVTFLSLRVAMKLGGWLFSINNMDSASIFGLGMTVYLLFHSLANRKLIGPRWHFGFSLTGFIIAIVVTIALCGLATVVPVLRS